jgi:hypothetical protein
MAKVANITINLCFIIQRYGKQVTFLSQKHQPNMRQTALLIKRRHNLPPIIEAFSILFL